MIVYGVLSWKDRYKYTKYFIVINAHVLNTLCKWGEFIRSLFTCEKPWPSLMSLMYEPPQSMPPSYFTSYLKMVKIIDKKGQNREKRDKVGVKQDRTKGKTKSARKRVFTHWTTSGFPSNLNGRSSLAEMAWCFACDWKIWLKRLLDIWAQFLVITEWVSWFY